MPLPFCCTDSYIGEELPAFVEKLGWTLDASTGIVSIPPNPDNQIESTIVQENIQLPRESSHFTLVGRLY